MGGGAPYVKFSATPLGSQYAKKKKLSTRNKGDGEEVCVLGGGGACAAPPLILY